jgi:hypothetical protein
VSQVEDAIALGILGVARKSVVCLLVIGVIVLIAGLIDVGARLGSGRERPSR